MRNLLEQEKHEKKKQRNIVVGGIILIALMLFSTLGYAFINQEKENQNEVSYLGKTFYLSNGYWISQFNSFIFYSSVYPKNLTQINSSLKGINEYLNQPVYVYSEEENSRFSVYKNLNEIATRIQDACIKEPCEGDLPLKNCADSKMFIIKESNETKVYQASGCVYIEGQQEELNSLTNSAIFKVFKT